MMVSLNYSRNLATLVQHAFVTTFHVFLGQLTVTKKMADVQLARLMYNLQEFFAIVSKSKLTSVQGQA